LVKRCTGISQSSNRIPYKPKFFSGFRFATAKVAYITANVLHIIDNDNNKNNDNDKYNDKDSLQIERLTKSGVEVKVKI